MAAATVAVRKGSGRVYLLPNYDEYVVAYSDRSTVYAGGKARGGDSRNNILFNHTIILDGKVAGTWRRGLTKTRVTIEAKPYLTLNTTQRRKIAAAAERYGTFLGLEAKLEFVD